MFAISTLITGGGCGDCRFVGAVLPLEIAVPLEEMWVAESLSRFVEVDRKAVMTVS